MLVAVVARDGDQLPVRPHRSAEREEFAMSAQHLFGERNHVIGENFAVRLRIIRQLFVLRIAHWGNLSDEVTFEDKNST